MASRVLGGALYAQTGQAMRDEWNRMIHANGGARLERGVADFDC